MISFGCPSCQIKLTVKPEYAGRSSKCPSCKQPLTVPGLDQTQAYVPPQQIDGEESCLAKIGHDGGVTLEHDPAGRNPTTAQKSQRSVGEALAGRKKRKERFIIEGEGAYSTVDGERVPMRPGDFVLTPYWCWHDHGHAGTEPVIWLDALDNPFAQFFGTMFRENYPHDSQAVTLTAGNTAARYGEGLMPIEYRGSQHASPLLAYPYDRTREALHRLAIDVIPHRLSGFDRGFPNAADRAPGNALDGAVEQPRQAAHRRES